MYVHCMRRWDCLLMNVWRSALHIGFGPHTYISQCMIQCVCFVMCICISLSVTINQGSVNTVSYIS